MKPLDLTSAVGPVGVGLIAVEEDDIALIGSTLLATDLNRTLATFQIHQKKAVEGLTTDAISWHVAEASDDYRIEEELLRKGAGSINIKIGTGLDIFFGGYHMVLLSCEERINDE